MATQSKQKKLKGGKQKLKLFRANEPLKSVLMWGINHSITTLRHMKPRAVLLKDDFKAYLKIKVKGHLFNKENMPSRFKFKEYCPLAFQNLRERFGVDTNDFWESFTRNQPLWDSICGKSGSKFLVTYNRHFVLKSISSEEVEQMHHFIENYHEYVVNCHGQTLLPQYLGMYRITVNDTETYLLVMRNVFSPRVPIHKKYDLKAPIDASNMHNGKNSQHSLPSLISHSCIGSTNNSFNSACRMLSCINCGGSVVDREANEKEKKYRNLSKKHSLRHTKPLPTLKDNDFVNDICKIYIGEQSKERLLQHLRRDIVLLQENNLMDYSVLIGIHDVEIAGKDESGMMGYSTGCFSEIEIGRDPNHESIVAVGYDAGTASAGDGLGEIFAQSEENMIIGGSGTPFNCSGLVLGSYGSNAGVILRPYTNSLEEVDLEDDKEAGLSDRAASPIDFDADPPLSGKLTPPESPSDISRRFQPFLGELNPNFEFYGIKGSPNLGRPVIYFVAVIDILTRYGMRKRTAQTYKTVKHGTGSEITTVRPDVYGHRLLDFIDQCIE